MRKNYNIEDLLRGHASRRFLAVDVYETGTSVNKFCDLLESCLGHEGCVKIIALTSESNFQKAIHDPRIFKVVQISDHMIKPNDDFSSMRKSLGRPFGWDKWLKWKDILAEPPFRCPEAEKLCEQIRHFAATKKTSGHP